MYRRRPSRRFVRRVFVLQELHLQAAWQGGFWCLFLVPFWSRLQTLGGHFVADPTLNGQFLQWSDWDQIPLGTYLRTQLISRRYAHTGAFPQHRLLVERAPIGFDERLHSLTRNRGVGMHEQQHF